MNPSCKSNMDQMRLQYPMGSPQLTQFNKLARYMISIGKEEVFEKSPTVRGQKIDLIALGNQVETYGGYEEVEGKQLWREIGVALGFGDSLLPAVVLKVHFEKYLRPFSEYTSALSQEEEGKEEESDQEVLEVQPIENERVTENDVQLWEEVSSKTEKRLHRRSISRSRSSSFSNESESLRKQQEAPRKRNDNGAHSKSGSYYRHNATSVDLHSRHPQEFIWSSPSRSVSNERTHEHQKHSSRNRNKKNIEPYGRSRSCSYTKDQCSFTENNHRLHQRSISCSRSRSFSNESESCRKQQEAPRKRNDKGAHSKSGSYYGHNSSSVDLHSRHPQEFIWSSPSRSVSNERISHEHQKYSSRNRNKKNIESYGRSRSCSYTKGQFSFTENNHSCHRHSSSNTGLSSSLIESNKNRKRKYLSIRNDEEHVGSLRTSQSPNNHRDDYFSRRLSDGRLPSPRNYRNDSASRTLCDDRLQSPSNHRGSYFSKRLRNDRIFQSPSKCGGNHSFTMLPDHRVLSPSNHRENCPSRRPPDDRWLFNESAHFADEGIGHQASSSAFLMSYEQGPYNSSVKNEEEFKSEYSQLLKEKQAQINELLQDNRCMKLQSENDALVKDNERINTESANLLKEKQAQIDQLLQENQALKLQISNTPENDVLTRVTRLFNQTELESLDEQKLASLEILLESFTIKVRKIKEDLRTCCICLERAKSVLFLPCAHLCTCAICSISSDTCPLCSENIEQKINAFT